MTKPLHTRPFNLEHAKAGAPFCCANGWAVQILKWDCRGAFPLIGIIRHLSSDCPSLWSVAGVGDAGGDDRLVMTPLGMLDGKPVFVGDELIDVKNGRVVTAKPAWSRMNPDLWRWPAPALVYPETRMTPAELELAIVVADQTIVGRCRAVANAALRHAIDAGQVVEPFQGTLNHESRRLYGSVADVDHFAALMLQLDPRAPTKEAYDQCSRDLGKAERLLERMGWRSDSGSTTGWSYGGCDWAPETASRQVANEERK